MMKWLQKMGQTFLMGSFWAVLWLVSALENGVGGARVMWSIAGIVLIWIFLIGFESWRERDRSRREYRYSSRIRDKVLNEQAKGGVLSRVLLLSAKKGCSIQ